MVSKQYNQHQWGLKNTYYKTFVYNVTNQVYLYLQAKSGLVQLKNIPKQWQFKSLPEDQLLSFSQWDIHYPITKMRLDACEPIT